MIPQRGSNRAVYAGATRGAQTSAAWIPPRTAMPTTSMASVVAAARANRLRVAVEWGSRPVMPAGIGFRSHRFARFRRFPLFFGSFGSPFCGPFLGGGFFSRQILFANEFNCFGGGFVDPGAFFSSDFSSWQNSSVDVPGQQMWIEAGDEPASALASDGATGGTSEGVAGWIGIVCESLDGAGGLKVTGVRLDGPAGLAGLAAGDTITEVEGRPVESVKSFEEEIASLAPGSQIHIHFVHRGWQIEAPVTIGEAPRTSIR
jgi:hypothetical protein